MLRPAAIDDPLTRAAGAASDAEGVPHAGRVNAGRAAKSMLWSAVENGGLALVSFSSLIVYSRFLTAAEFGVFSIALAVVELLGLLVNMLFHDALVQKEKVSALHFDTAFTFTAGLSLVLLGGCVLFAPTFAGLLGNRAAAPVLSWMALCFPASALSATLVAEQRRELAFKTLALRSLVGRLSGAFAGIVLVVLGAGLWGLVAQQILIALAGSLVLWFRAGFRPRLRMGARELRELFAFGSYSIGSLFLSFAIKRIFVVVAGVMLGNEQAGYLNLSFRAVDVLWAIGASAISQVALPLLARLQTDRTRLTSAYRRASELACLALYPAFIGVAVVAPEIIELAFGRQWLACSPYVSVLALLVVVRASGMLLGPLLTALGRPSNSLLATATEFTVMLVLLSTLGAHSLGLAIGVWVARELVVAPLMVVLVRRATHFTLRELLSGAFVPLLASATMAAFVFAVRRVLPPAWPASARLAVLVPSGMVAFLAGVLLFDRRLLGRASEFVARALVRTQPKESPTCAS